MDPEQRTMTVYSQEGSDDDSLCFDFEAVIEEGHDHECPASRRAWQQQQDTYEVDSQVFSDGKITSEKTSETSDFTKHSFMDEKHEDDEQSSPINLRRKLFLLALVCGPFLLGLITFLVGVLVEMERDSDGAASSARVAPFVALTPPGPTSQHTTKPLTVPFAPTSAPAEKPDVSEQTTNVGQESEQEEMPTSVPVGNEDTSSAPTDQKPDLEVNSTPSVSPQFNADAPTLPPVSPTLGPTRLPVPRWPTEAPSNAARTALPTARPLVVPTPSSPQTAGPTTLTVLVAKEPSAPIVSVDTPPFPDFRYTPYDDLSIEVQDLSRRLGYDRSSWNHPGTLTVENYSYDGLLTRAGGNHRDVDAVMKLGFTSDSWDCWVNHFFDYSWERLRTANVQQSYEALGWNAISWSSHNSEDWPQAWFKPYSTLSDLEKEAAARLCYSNAMLWNGEQLPETR